MGSLPPVCTEHEILLITMPSKQLIAILAVIWGPRPTPMAGAFSIGSSQRTNPPKDVSSTTTNTNNRRQLLSSIFGLAPSILMIESAYASCITGDESVDCIGVYKEGIPESSNDGIYHNKQSSNLTAHSVPIVPSYHYQIPHHTMKPWVC